MPVHLPLQQVQRKLYCAKLGFAFIILNICRCLMASTQSSFSSGYLEDFHNRNYIFKKIKDSGLPFPACKSSQAQLFVRSNHLPDFAMKPIHHLCLHLFMCTKRTVWVKSLKYLSIYHHTWVLCISKDPVYNHPNAGRV